MRWRNSVVLKPMVSATAIRQQQGMTLLELLVAVSLLAVIAVMAYASLFTLTASKRQMDDTVSQINQDNAALGLFNQDIKMAIGHQSVQHSHELLPFTGDSQSLRLQRYNPFQAVPRHGLVNQLKQQPAAVLSVRWFVRDQTWYRATRAATSSSYAPWQEQAMMPLQQIRCQYQSLNGQLLDRWPPAQGPVTALPNAVHCRLMSQHNRESDLIITPWQQIW